ncbi:hypothetical protein C8J56DRAFT_1042043 [Mycena floridula]|nr:hypothetical protein C8J56DRAFT_1056491 [Mycena floridula]KAJ7597873.1 hypothetical protein C8J56DRAFT_1042043 [Mycena floridula]
MSIVNMEDKLDIAITLALTDGPFSRAFEIQTIHVDMKVSAMRFPVVANVTYTTVPFSTLMAVLAQPHNILRLNNVFQNIVAFMPTLPVRFGARRWPVNALDEEITHDAHTGFRTLGTGAEILFYSGDPPLSTFDIVCTGESPGGNSLLDPWLTYTILCAVYDPRSYQKWIATLGVSVGDANNSPGPIIQSASPSSLFESWQSSGPGSRTFSTLSSVSHSDAASQRHSHHILASKPTKICVPHHRTILRVGRSPSTIVTPNDNLRRAFISLDIDWHVNGKNADAFQGSLTAYTIVEQWRNLWAIVSIVIKVGWSLESLLKGNTSGRSVPSVLVDDVEVNINAVISAFGWPWRTFQPKLQLYQWIYLARTQGRFIGDTPELPESPTTGSKKEYWTEKQSIWLIWLGIFCAWNLNGEPYLQHERDLNIGSSIIPKNAPILSFNQIRDLWQKKRSLLIASVEIR